MEWLIFLFPLPWVFEYLFNGYTVRKDQGKGRAYWYLRSKHKLALQVRGLNEQLDAVHVRARAWERAYQELRTEVRRGRL